MEGSVSRVFRQSLQPAEIGRKLEHAMTGNQRVSVGAAIVPNDYVVELHPKDFAQIAGYSQGLARQMESWLAGVAGEQGFTVIDRLRVRFEESDRAAVHAPRVRATITDREPANGHDPARSIGQRTEMFQAAGQGAREVSLRLRVLSGSRSGTEVAIDRDHLTVGRSTENDVVFDTPDVSRRHARIERSKGQLRIVDLSSTNGTRVNGIAISVSELTPGDEITFGGQRAQVIGRERGRERSRFAPPGERS
ncbi:MAG: DUF3662 and FHA domain-containing protein [Chloroflexia bacterium]|nr:DUF3662 and FHA domain-containing protein [Chloroflexia bacterium]